MTNALQSSVKQAPLKEFLQQHANVYHPPAEDGSTAHSWRVIRQEFLKDKHEVLTIQDLIVALRRDGQYRHAITLNDRSNYSLPNGNDYNNPGKVVSNGTHRLVAAMIYAERTGNWELPIQYTELAEADCEKAYTYYETTLTLPNPVSSETIAKLGDAMSVSRTTANGEWLEVEFVASAHNQYVVAHWGDVNENPYGTEEVHRLLRTSLVHHELIDEETVPNFTTTLENL